MGIDVDVHRVKNAHFSTLAQLLISPMSRPSLLQAGETSQNVNILDTAQGFTPTRSGELYTPKKLLWLFVPVIAVAIWAVQSRQEAAPPDAQTTTVAAAATANAPPAHVATQDLAQVTAAPHPPEQVAAGQHDLGTKHPATDSVNGTPALTTAAGLGQPEGRSAEAPGLLTPSNHAGRSPNTVAPKAKPAVATKTAQKPVDAQRPKTSEVPRVVAQTTKRPTDGQGDADVELLNALMQHMGTTKPKTGAPRTLAERVNECKRTGRGDALACQRRVCAGAWGKSKACPAHLAAAQMRPPAEARSPN